MIVPAQNANEVLDGHVLDEICSQRIATIAATAGDTTTHRGRQRLCCRAAARTRDRSQLVCFIFAVRTIARNACAGAVGRFICMSCCCWGPPPAAATRCCALGAQSGARVEGSGSPHWATRATTPSRAPPRTPFECTHATPVR